MENWSAKNTNREAQYAGSFYPENKNSLLNELGNYFLEAEKKNSKTEEKLSSEQKLRAIISPHAGYVFSGKVAASAYHQIPEKANYQRVFVLASSHGYSFKGASVYTSGNYKTPLGEIKVDSQLGKNLIESSEYFINHSESHVNEHSLEVQLPFLQYKLGSNFLLVPVILGTRDPEVCKKIANELKPWFTPENLFVISTDFSHYPNYKDANKVDFLTAQSICSNQPETLLAVLKENKNLEIDKLATSLCGWTSVLTLLYLTENKPFLFKQISYQNSGDSKIHSDKSRVVGYWAIDVFEDAVSFTIDENEKTEILEKSRNAIHSFVKTGRSGEIAEPLSNGILNEITGVFVSIYVKDKLRGCIGGFAQEKTLNDLVQKMAVSAACDSRFKSVKVDDLDNMELEISVLSPIKEIKSIDEIELGKHGIFIRQGLNSGTFLPQVATKTGWNKEEFLGHCSRDKARIGWDGWKTAEIFTFEAVIFRGV